MHKKTREGTDSTLAGNYFKPKMITGWRRRASPIAISGLSSRKRGAMEMSGEFPRSWPVRSRRRFRAAQPAAVRAMAGIAAGAAGVSIPRISQCRGRTDRPHRREGARRQRRADRQWPPAHLQGTGGLVEPAGACAGRELRRQARQPRADPFGQQSGAGRRMARRRPRPAPSSSTPCRCCAPAN